LNDLTKAPPQEFFADPREERTNMTAAWFAARLLPTD